ncbi:hypothetical protein BD626DRAFT_562710 [Schizophyllum amplum]|uniref:Uncharacterized protein n=1 Tax=Schizophyllum amplum TaxID=97359 RepID=A0A550CVU0_9AGAR|nr:hypothetical protein BD626DRAFT_562710 [Auriculariopsis ampla]
MSFPLRPVSSSTFCTATSTLWTVATADYPCLRRVATSSMLVAADDDGDSEDPFLDIIATHGLPS